MNKKSILFLFCFLMVSFTSIYANDYGNIFFIQLADIHLCNDSEVEKVFGGKIPPVSTVKKVINEVLAYHPDVVVQTGDIVALADRYDLDTDERWYKLVNSTIYTPITSHGIPFLYAPGNHDPAGYRLSDINTSDPRYYNGLIFKYIDKGKNKTYYSYDVGNYHFIMLDPKETKESGYRSVILPEEQKEWLINDLQKNKDKFIIIAYHQPLGSWYINDSDEFIKLISPYKGHILLIAGHTHDNRLIYRDGIPEYQGGAVCGDWWQTGKTPDGYPMGYVIYYITNGTVHRFYKGIGLTKQINILKPREVVLNETTPIELNVYWQNKTIINITYLIDNNKSFPLNFTLINTSHNIWWYHAVGYIHPILDNKTHNITIIVKSKDGDTFNISTVYIFSNNKIFPISEIINDTNFKKYYGRFVTINGTVTNVAYYGNLLTIKDNSGEIKVWAGDCHHKEFKIGDKIILRGEVSQFKGTKELKLISDNDAIIYGHENITKELIKIDKIKEIYSNYSKLEGKYIEVHGVVTALFDNGNEIYIQDSTAGLQIWAGEIKHPKVKVGDYLIVRGILSKYHNMPEIEVSSKNDFIINGTAPVPKPIVINLEDIPKYLGSLVKVKNVKVIEIDNSKIIVTDGKINGTIWCKYSGFNPLEEVKVGDVLDIVGIAKKYNTIYEIVPRNVSDIVKHPSNTQLK